MPWRTNVGQPLSFCNKMTEAESNGVISGDENAPLDESLAVPNGHEQTFAGFLATLGNDTENTPNLNLDGGGNHSNSQRWIDRFVEPGLENDSGKTTTDLDSDFFDDGGTVEPDSEADPVFALVSSNSMSNLIEKAVAQNSAVASVDFPWERGIFKDLFKRDTFPSMLANVPLENAVGRNGPISAEAVQECVLEGSHSRNEHVFMRAVTNISDKCFLERRKEQTDLAISKWLCVLKSYLLASTTGRQIIHLGKNMVQSEASRKIVHAVIGVRSPTTAINRANCILRFYRWVADVSITGFHPFQEQVVWEYLNSLQQSHAAPSTGVSLLSAFRYAKFVFGFNTIEDILSSRRIKGLTDIMFVSKRFLKQAKVLSVSQVQELHRLVKCDGLCGIDKAAAGYLLIALYGRCRHSDLACVEDILHDWDDSGGYLEIRTAVHKTSRSIQKKTRLLPIVIPVIGVTGECWVQDVERAFDSIGLKLRGHIGGPIFRPPRKDGSLCKRGLLSSECSKFLQLFLDEPSSPHAEGEQVMTSHALKATCLSWASKYGLSPEDKAALGRHSSATSESSAVYSRDLATRSVSLLQQLFIDIHNENFLPDASRRDYFPSKRPGDVLVSEQTEQGAAEEVVQRGDNGESIAKVEDEAVEISSDEEVSDSSSSESECESSGESDDGGNMQEPRPKVVRGFRVFNGKKSFMKHVVSRVVHYIDPDASTASGNTLAFACGRRPNPNFVAVSDFDSTYMCKLCKTRAMQNMNLGG